MELTKNLSLSKPDYTDVADVEVLDDNFDILDGLFDGDKIVKTVNNIKPVNHNVTLDLGVTSVNGMTGAVTIVERTVKQLIDILYPVGCFFDTTDTAFNPNISWGGTWEKITNGTVLIAGGGSYNINQIYGEATHKLKINELPSHNHSASASTDGNHNHSASASTNGDHYHGSVGRNTASGPYGVYDSTANHAGMSGSDGDNNTWKTSTNGSHSHTISINASGNHSHTITIGNTGSGVAFNLIQPSLAVARWHRTA